MKRLWKFGFIGLLLTTGIVSEGKAAIENVEKCLILGIGEGRLNCQLIDTGNIIEKSLCFPCSQYPTEASLKGLCKQIYPDKCTPISRCASDYLERCKKGCVGAAIQKNCETLCEEYYKKNCNPFKGCREILMDRC